MTARRTVYDFAVFPKLCSGMDRIIDGHLFCLFIFEYSGDSRRPKKRESLPEGRRDEFRERMDNVRSINAVKKMSD